MEIEFDEKLKYYQDRNGKLTINIDELNDELINSNIRISNLENNIKLLNNTISNE